MTRTGLAPVTADVCPLDRRRHARAVIALDDAARRDPRRLYGAPSAAPLLLAELVEHLRRGAGLVAVRGGAVEGFALYALTKTALDVTRLVCTFPTSEALLVEALEVTRQNAGRADLLLPFVLDLS